VIEKRTLKNGRRVYRVRWREAGRGSHEHVRSFDRREDAVRFETDLRRRKQLGEIGSTDAGSETLDEWAREWFVSYARPNLAGTRSRTTHGLGMSTSCRVSASSSYGSSRRR
jgi:hypothetical protein